MNIFSNLLIDLWLDPVINVWNSNERTWITQFAPSINEQMRTLKKFRPINGILIKTYEHGRRLARPTSSLSALTRAPPLSPCVFVKMIKSSISFYFNLFKLLTVQVPPSSLNAHTWSSWRSLIFALHSSLEMTVKLAIVCKYLGDSPHG